jgi:putative SOS response-associated peptidase YedK
MVSEFVMDKDVVASYLTKILEGVGGTRCCGHRSVCRIVAGKSTDFDGPLARRVLCVAMCGRFTLRVTGEAFERQFGITRAPSFNQHVNIAPGRCVVVIRLGVEKPSLITMPWGLIPAWAPRAEGHRYINARAETVATKPAFRAAFRERRCLIAPDGFYEWQVQSTGKKQPWHFAMPDALFAFAGIWERWSGWGDTDVSTCAIITCEAEGGDRSIHPRMPAILPQAAYSTWLDPKSGLDTLRSLLRPSRGLRHMAVSTLVNDPANDGPECLREASTMNRS